MDFFTAMSQMPLDQSWGEDPFANARMIPTDVTHAKPSSSWGDLLGSQGPGDFQLKQGAAAQAQYGQAPQMPSPMSTLQGLMAMTGRGGQQPYEPFMQGYQNPYLSGLMRF